MNSSSKTRLDELKAKIGQQLPAQFDPPANPPAVARAEAPLPATAAARLRNRC